MTTEQYSQLTDALERYGLPTLFSLALLALLYLLIDAIRSRLKSDGQNNLEDTKIQITNAQTIQILANGFQGLERVIESAVTAIDTSSTRVTSLEAKMGTVQSTLVSHIDGIINPYQDIHKGHTQRLERIIATTDAILESVQAIRSTAKQALNETGEHPAITISPDGQKEYSE